MAKVLLVAPSCDGTDVGEAFVAYQWASRLSLRHDLTVLSYRGAGRPSASEQLPTARVVEWEQPAFLTRAARLNSLMKPWYPLFYAHARRWIRQAIASGERFDVAHQPVPVAMRYPSPLQGLGIPYVIGPVGGSLESPKTFEAEDTAPWYVGLRRLDQWRMRHDRRLRASYRDAAVVLGIAPYVAETLDSLELPDLRWMSETGAVSLPPPVDRSERTGPVRFLFVGRLIRTKGVRDAIRAIAQVRGQDLVLDVVGDGFDRPACEELVRSLGLDGVVSFHGALPRAAVDDFYRRADVFLFPSYREPGGNVPFEAMAWGLPLIVSDRGGPANVVKDEFGVRVPAVDPESFAEGLAVAIGLLAGDPIRRQAMGAAARRDVTATGTWDRRVEQAESIYAELGAGADGQGLTACPLSSQTLPDHRLPGLGA